MNTLAFSQEKMRVVRTKSVDRSLPVSNVYVDKENYKWAANTEGIFQVYNIENGVGHDVSTSHLNILSFPSRAPASSRAWRFRP